MSNAIVVTETLPTELRKMIDGPDDGIDLARAALWLAKEEYPTLDIPAYHRRLDTLAWEAWPRVSRVGANPFAIIDALNDFLFLEKGFRGNTAHYFDPRNSYLNEVMDRRRGIPITLSVIYMEIARRLDFPIEGVGFPGHFLVRHARQGREILIDPYRGGEILHPEDCRARLTETFGEDVCLESRFLEAVDKRCMLARMLNNLKHIYLRDEDYVRVLRVIDQLLALTPDEVHHIRDRGVARFKLVRLAGAAADFETYLRRSPDAPDASMVRRQLRTIRRLTAMLN